jgi:hypothetical protein
MIWAEDFETITITYDLENEKAITLFHGLLNFHLHRIKNKFHTRKIRHVISPQDSGYYCYI